MEEEDIWVSVFQSVCLHLPLSIITRRIKLVRDYFMIDYTLILYFNCRNYNVVFVMLNFFVADLSGHAGVRRRIYKNVLEKSNAQSAAYITLILRVLLSINCIWIKAAEQLLDIVMNKFGSVYKLFLILTGQLQIYGILLLDSLLIASLEGKTFIYSSVSCGN